MGTFHCLCLVIDQTPQKTKYIARQEELSSTPIFPSGTHTLIFNILSVTVFYIIILHFQEIGKTLNIKSYLQSLLSVMSDLLLFFNMIGLKTSLIVI